MGQFRRGIRLQWFYRKRFRQALFLVCILGFVRLSKGAGFLDAFNFLSRPFWPGSAQKEWLQDAQNLEQLIKLDLLEKDNARLREMLALKTISQENKISAAVISRQTNGWWQQLELNKGKKDGIKIGDSVVAPGGLVGIVSSVTLTTSRVRLLTSPGSRVGVWIARIQRHGLLIGMGTNRTKLAFFDKDPDAQPGDVVSTSPASTLVPANLPIGVIQSIDKQSSSAPFAIIQLLAAPEAIDWVQILIGG